MSLQKLRELEKQAAVLREQENTLKRKKHRLTTREGILERKRETRRKILAGAMRLSQAREAGQEDARLLGELDRYLIRPQDRALFGLPPRPEV